MKLYGSIAEQELNYGRWYFDQPEYWSKDKDAVKNHPFMDIIDSDWSDIDRSVFKVYELDIDWMEFDRVLDLRGQYWKEKLATFVEWYGDGWSSKGGLWSEKSPLTHITHLGNYNALASKGYRWVVCNHGPDTKGEYIELWQYIEVLSGPGVSYSMKQLDAKEFF